MTTLEERQEWQNLSAHHKKLTNQRMINWFQVDLDRFNRFSLSTCGLLLDYSKNLITDETVKLLCNLAAVCDLNEKKADLFSGKAINFTENKPVLHTALRSNDHHFSSLVKESLEKMQTFTQQFRNKQWFGATGKPLNTIVNIGIGGSYLGPLMTTHALKSYASSDLHCFFISDIDSLAIKEILDQINPETTLFIISSKSFTTIETLANANCIRNWLCEKLSLTHVEKHFVAVTANVEKAIKWGLPISQIFTFWEWVGGRYSIWSAIGLPLALMIGMDQFNAFLKGAADMDEHFKTAPFAANMPVLMALIGIWYINFFHAHSLAILPYTHALAHFHTYLQQTDMESNGKYINRHGKEVNYVTGPIVWGEKGCHGQHAFYQSLHQGKNLIPVDFIFATKEIDFFSEQENLLAANCFSQAHALMKGKTYEEIFQELLSLGYSEEEARFLAPHKVVPGNKPSNTLILETMSPYHLGALIALYEHKIFVQGAIWNINSYDQWGVELGKQLSSSILDKINGINIDVEYDSSTQGLINYFQKIRDKT